MNSPHDFQEPNDVATNKEVTMTRRTFEAPMIPGCPVKSRRARLVISMASVLLLLVVSAIYSGSSSFLSIADPTSGCRYDHQTIEQETSNYKKEHSDSGPYRGQQQQQQSRTSKLGDDCYHVFLDVGANIGVHSRFLMEPDSYPLAKSAKGHFDRIYGTQRDNRDFCMFAFEPNPVHKQRHEMFAQAYEQMGWRYHYIGAGVGDQDGNLTFYHMDGEGYNEWGFSTVKEKCEGRNNQGCEPEIVPVTHLASWIDEHIHQRKLPEVVHGNFEAAGPKVGTYFTEIRT
jgi:hypothetical protein